MSRDVGPHFQQSEAPVVVVPLRGTLVENNTKQSENIANKNNV